MSVLQFTDRFQSAPLLLGERVEPGGSLLDAELLFTIGFFTEGIDWPGPVTPQEAWDAPSGIICLFGARVQTPAHVVAGIRALGLAADVRVLWIRNPGAPVDSWDWASLSVEHAEDQARLTAAATLPLTDGAAPFHLDLPAGAAIAFDASLFY